MDRLVREDLAKLGAQLRHARLQLGLTQAEVGERAGISRQLVNRLEAGRNGEIAAVLAMANVLDRRLQLIEPVPPKPMTPSEAEEAAQELIARLRKTGKAEVYRPR